MAGAAISAPDCDRAWSEFRAEAAPLIAGFENSLSDPRAAQEKRLLSLLKNNEHTAYGRKYDFATIDSFDSYNKRVPVTHWADMKPWASRASRSDEPVLTAEAPLFFERTSGSSAATKLIPYTRALLGEFQNAVIVWLARLYDECPNIGRGRSYWALSPAGATGAVSANGIAIGSASDARYLEGSSAMRLLPTVLNPRGVSDEPENWRIATLAEMIEADDLTMISVWSPTFLTALLQPLTGADDSAAIRERLWSRISPDRRNETQKAIDTGDFSALWPALEIVSCWMDGPSAAYAAALQSLFPRARLSQKGLLATEGVVSIPWGLSGRCPLAIESHVLEFVDDEERVHLADALVAGGRYRPLLTTGGGLYRYCLGDIVEVVGFEDRTPCVRFAGRSDARSDLVGEKLDEVLVSVACRVLPGGMAGAFLVPQPDADPPCYQLLAEPSAVADADETAAAVEQELMKIFHYAQARKQGQLGPLAVRTIRNSGYVLQRAWEAIGQRAGDVKPSMLISSLAYARAIMAAVADDDSN